MVEVIVTIVVPAEHTPLGYGGADVEPARTEVYRLEFRDYAYAYAYLTTGRNGVYVRDSVDGREPTPGCTNFVQLVGQTTEDLPDV